MGGDAMCTWFYAERSTLSQIITKAQQLPLADTMKTQCITSGTEPEKAEPAFAQKVIVRKDGIEVEMPPDISEELLLTLLRGLKEC